MQLETDVHRNKEDILSSGGRYAEYTNVGLIMEKNTFNYRQMFVEISSVLHSILTVTFVHSLFKSLSRKRQK